MDSNHRVELSMTLNSLGFKIILQIAEKLIKANTDVMLAEENPQQGELLRIRVQSYRKFLNQLLILLQSAQEGEFDPDEDGGFNEVVI